MEKRTVKKYVLLFEPFGYLREETSVEALGVYDTIEEAKQVAIDYLSEEFDFIVDEQDLKKFEEDKKVLKISVWWNNIENYGCYYDLIIQELIYRC